MSSSLALVKITAAVTVPVNYVTEGRCPMPTGNNCAALLPTPCPGPAWDHLFLLGAKNLYSKSQVISVVKNEHRSTQILTFLGLELASLAGKEADLA